MDHPGPYISLVVVTRHDTSPGLFNTKFRLNFGPNANRPEEEGPTDLTIGRSSLCNMVLDYRTVSTVHAKLMFRNGEFFVQDSHSSNGTMVYLQGPLPLVNSQTVRLRMGRSTLALQVTHIQTFILLQLTFCTYHRRPSDLSLLRFVEPSSVLLFQLLVQPLSLISSTSCP